MTSGTITARAAHKARWSMPGEPDFADIGFDVFDENVVDFLVTVCIEMMTSKGWMADSHGETRVNDIGELYYEGVYVPLCKRLVFTEQVDIRNCPLPKSASLARLEYGQTSFTRAEMVPRLPRDWASPVAGSFYRVTCLYKTKREADLSAYTYFVVVKGDGTVLPCVWTHGVNHDGKVALFRGLWAFWATITLNAFDDARSLWSIVTHEDILGSGLIRTPLLLGSDPERVKSLFYARSLPMTATGRKRPILHWVEAHNRRLRNGTDIDISKYLRGIEKFEMGGFTFEIRNPTKTPRIARS